MCVVLLLNIQAICREIIRLEECLILLYMLVLISSVGYSLDLSKLRTRVI